MRLILVTGMSGAGRSFVMRTLEDIGYEVVDNLPIAMLPDLLRTAPPETTSMAVGYDTRNRHFSVPLLLETLRGLPQIRNDLQSEILFLDCEDAILLRRFNESRRPHPMDDEDGRVLDHIHKERALIGPLRAHADYILDSTLLSLPELRRWVTSQLTPFEAHPTLAICVRSFSYRYGIPREADIVLDVRFLRNPHYVEALRHATGIDQEVQDLIEKDPAFYPILEHLLGMVQPLLPQYRNEGKSYLTIAFGCTGGQHRSVCVAERFAARVRALGWDLRVDHRELRAS